MKRSRVGLFVFIDPGGGGGARAPKRRVPRVVQMRTGLTRTGGVLVDELIGKRTMAICDSEP